VVTNAELATELRLLDFDATETAIGVVVNLPNTVLFEFGSSALAPSAVARLEPLAAYLVRHEVAARRLTIAGHTDSVGSEEANQRLSEERALSVQAALKGHGVGEARMEVLGLGETRPVAPNARPDGADDAEGRARNRRVEILIHSAVAQQRPRAASLERGLGQVDADPNCRCHHASVASRRLVAPPSNRL
jgi:outer membrane protein OmpA-like peptidoglycan-associated protein